MDQTSGNTREDWQQTSENLRRTAADERRKAERLASQLSREALSQLQRSIEGALALPTATALGIGSITLYAAAFLERGFEVVQQSVAALGRGLDESRRELDRRDDADGRRLRDRLDAVQNQNRAGEAQA